MARLDFSEYYKPKTNKAPSQRYYEPPKPKSVPKREQLPPVFDEFANPYPPPRVEYVKPNAPPIYKNFTVPANAYKGGMYPVTDSYEYPYAAPEPKFDFPKIGAPTDPWGGWRALQNWSSSTVSGMQNSAANMITSIGRYFQERSKPPFSYTDEQPYKQYLPIVSTPWASTVAPNNIPPPQIPAAKPGNKPWASNGASVPAISYVNRLQGAWNGAYLFPDIKSGYSTVNPNANMNLPMLNPRITGVWNDEHPYPNQQAGYSTQTPTYPFPIVNPEPYGDLFDNVTYEDPGGGGGGGGWGGWGGWGGGGAYGASSGVNSYLPGTRAGYGANASSPRYTGGGGGRASSYAGGQYANQAAWRMPMLVWNI